jgi:hypothetical protein
MYTDNYGKSWKNLVDEDKVWGYTLSVIQDPVAESLLFLGTENGLFISLDKGAAWTKWNRDYPSASTMDLKIHPVEHDLIIATFGRSLYIIDDIRPLRILAKEGLSLLENNIKAYPVPIAYHMSSLSQAGVYGAGDGYFSGQTESSGAILTYSVKEPIKARQRSREDAEVDEEEAARMEEMRSRMARFSGRFGGMRGEANREFEPVRISIFNESGDKIRSLEDYPKAGINRTSWRLDEVEEDQDAQASRRRGSGRSMQRSGTPVLPGTYKAVFEYGGEKDSAMVSVDIDPRIDYKMDDLIARKEFARAFQEKAKLLDKGNEALNTAKAAIDLIKQQIPRGRGDDIRELREKTQAVEDSLTSIMNELSPPRDENAQGIVRGEGGVQSEVSSVARSLPRGFGPVSGTEKIEAQLAEEKLADALEKINRFFTDVWPDFKEFINNSALTPFKDRQFEPLKF